MDLLLHITGLAFIPLMAYILYLGIDDIISELTVQFMPQRTKEISQIYKFQGISICCQIHPSHN